MESTISARAVTSVLVLLVCVVASFRTPGVRPPRMVTEVVSVVFTSPRARAAGVVPTEVTALVASGVADAQARTPEPEHTEPAMPATTPHAQLVSVRDTPGEASVRPRSRPGMRVARARDGAAPRQFSAAARQARGTRPAAGRNDVSGAPRPPAVFVPLQQLGLAIQAKLAGAAAQQPPPDHAGPDHRRQQRAAHRAA